MNIKVAKADGNLVVSVEPRTPEDMDKAQNLVLSITDLAKRLGVSYRVERSQPVFQEGSDTSDKIWSAAIVLIGWESYDLFTIVTGIVSYFNPEMLHEKPLVPPAH